MFSNADPQPNRMQYEQPDVFDQSISLGSMPTLAIPDGIGDMDQNPIPDWEKQKQIARLNNAKTVYTNLLLFRQRMVDVNLDDPEMEGHYAAQMGKPRKSRNKLWLKGYDEYNGVDQ